ncbi:hypothetical protein SEA_WILLIAMBOONE_81 [Gordonia phage WilliamBoone]|nr:hypothetical protein SEA_WILLIAMBOONE_81 [Gordonia phage WilliamBoone]
MRVDGTTVVREFSLTTECPYCGTIAMHDLRAPERLPRREDFNTVEEYLLRRRWSTFNDGFMSWLGTHVRVSAREEDTAEVVRKCVNKKCVSEWCEGKVER